MQAAPLFFCPCPFLSRPCGTDQEPVLVYPALAMTRPVSVNPS